VAKKKVPEKDPARMDSQADTLAELIRHHNEKYWVEHRPEPADLLSFGMSVNCIFNSVARWRVTV